jgi:hypothetical protein
MSATTMPAAIVSKNCSIRHHPPCPKTWRIAPQAIYDNHQRIVKNFYTVKGIMGVVRCVPGEQSWLVDQGLSIANTVDRFM